MTFGYWSTSYCDHPIRNSLTNQKVCESFPFITDLREVVAARGTLSPLARPRQSCLIHLRKLKAAHRDTLDTLTSQSNNKPVLPASFLNRSHAAAPEPMTISPYACVDLVEEIIPTRYFWNICTCFYLPGLSRFSRCGRECKKNFWPHVQGSLMLMMTWVNDLQQS